MKRYILLAVTTTVAAVIAPVAYTIASCNNTTEKVQETSKEGTSVESKECGGGSIKVGGAGAEVEIPIPKGYCEISGVQRLGDLSVCQGTATGIDCDPQGASTTVRVFSGGSCAIFPTSKEEVNTWNPCKPPTVDQSTTRPSAAARKCTLHEPTFPPAHLPIDKVDRVDTESEISTELSKAVPSSPVPLPAGMVVPLPN